MAADVLTIRELDFEASFDPEQRSLVLVGTADASVAAQLRDLVTRIYATPGRDLAIDLRRVDFMAASCFNTFVVLVGWMSERPVRERYQIRFAIDGAVPWQRRSLAALTCFATDIVTVVD